MSIQLITVRNKLDWKNTVFFLKKCDSDSKFEPGL